jgi:hypothetical protein
MKSIIYLVVAIFTLVCFAQAQQAPDSVSVAYDSNPSSLQLRAQKGTNNTVTLTWRGANRPRPVSLCTKVSGRDIGRRLRQSAPI